MNVDEIRRIAEIMQKHELTEFSIESEDCRMKVRRGPKTKKVAAPASAMFAPPYAGAPTMPESNSGQARDNGGNRENAEADAAPPQNTIDCPIVGTFYSAPSPDAEPFVKVGDAVTPDTVVCIVEAMKVMNEIKAEKAGRIKRVLVENTQPVEFGEPLFELD